MYEPCPPSHQGWACAPKKHRPDPNRPPPLDCAKKEYLYFPLTAHTAVRAIRFDSPAMMRADCMKQVRMRLHPERVGSELNRYLKKEKIGSGEAHVGFALASAAKGLFSNIETGIYECCPLDPKTGQCVRYSKDDGRMKQCLCSGFFRFPGGQAALKVAAEKLSD